MTIIICPGIHETDLTESFISGCLSPSLDNLKSSSSSTLREAKATSPQSPIPSPQSPASSPQSPIPSPQSPASSPQSPIPSPQSPVPNPENILVAPVPGILALSSLHILQFLHDRLHHRLESPVIFISFSAGVVGAIAAAWQWQLLGGDVKAFIAIDGWGVPLSGKFPIHRLSHDYFTHWSSSLLGSGQDNFYAEPAVDHLTMWRSPQSVQGWWVDSSQGEITTPKTRLTAAEFLHLLLKHYEEK